MTRLSNIDVVRHQILELAAPILARCADVWREPQLTERLTLVVGARLHRSLGRCYPERRLVRIAPAALALPHSLREEIICHEAAHLVAFERHGRAERPHGAGWKRLMREIGFAPRVRIQLADGDAASIALARAPRRAYEHRCPVCQASRVARRKMMQWRCRECMTYGLEGRLLISRREA